MRRTCDSHKLYTHMYRYNIYIPRSSNVRYFSALSKISAFSSRHKFFSLASVFCFFVELVFFVNPYISYSILFSWSRLHDSSPQWLPVAGHNLQRTAQGAHFFFLKDLLWVFAHLEPGQVHTMEGASMLNPGKDRVLTGSVGFASFKTSETFKKSPHGS